VWKFTIRKNAFRLSLVKEWREVAGSHLLRKRGTMLHPSLLHWRQLQAGLNFRKEGKAMKVNVEIAGLPLYKTFGKNKKIEFEFPGSTLKELIDAMVRKFGFEVKKFLLDKNGDVDMDIRLLLNGATYLSENRMQTSLNDGDTLIFKAPS
jgi:hypothetical protein